MEYAIVDIETTGGHANGSGITEIAIVVHDGEKVIDRYTTLINPRRHIPLPIEVLTGINDEMVRDSPFFEDVAKTIFEWLRGRIFVAHNVNFDYSFIKYNLDACGYIFTATKLCTVRLSRKIKPGFRSYSLGNLCDALGIPLFDRHRAGGDADATAILFGKLLEWDMDGHIPLMLQRISKEQQLPPNLPKADFDCLPNCPGVYYFMDKSAKVVYVGKAKDIRKRVSSHFTGNNPNPQRQHFLRNIHAIGFEHCGTELMALLLEAVEIKRLWPPFNRAMKKQEPKFGLYVYEDQTCYLRLAIGKHRKGIPCVQYFNTANEAVNGLQKLIEDFGLDRALCNFQYERKSGLLWSCVEDPGMPVAEKLPAVIYNQKVRQALDDFENKQPSFAIMDKGRHASEKSVIWVEKGNFYAMGYVDENSDLSMPEEIRDSLNRYTGNHYMMQLIHAYAARYPMKVLRFS